MDEKLKILIVNDNAEILMVQDKMIDPKEFLVSKAMSGLDALALVQKMVPDIILLDVVLPDILGYEVCKRIKSDPRLSHILVLFVSAINISAKDQTTAFEAGGEGFIGWPFKKQDLDSRLKSFRRIILSERKLKKSEERYRSLYNSLPVAVLRSTPEGKVLQVNPAAVQMYGYNSKEEMLAVEADDYYSSIADREKMLDVLLKEGQIRNYITKEYKKDKSLIWVKSDYTALKDSEGNIQFIDVLSEDISQIKEAEDKLELSEKRFKAYIEYAPHGFFVANEKGEYIEVNKAASQITGYSEEELLQLSIADITPKDAFNIAMNHFKKVSDTGSAIGDVPFLRKNGERRIWSVSAVKINPELFVAFVIDITDRKSTEEALIESEDRLKLATKSAHIGIWDLDLISNVLVWDEGMYDMYGIDPNDFKGDFESWLKYIHTDDHEVLVNDLKHEIKDRTAINSEYRIIRPDKQIRNIESYAYIHKNEDNVPSRIVGVNIDISEKKQAEVKFKTIFNTINDTVLICDFNDRIYECNSISIKRYGYAREHLLGMKSAGLVSEEDKAYYLRQIEVVKNSGHITFECVHVNSSGKSFPVELSANQINYFGDSALLFVIRDISRRKNIESQLQLTQFAFDNANISIFMIQPDGEIFYINETACSQLGYQTSDLISKYVWDIRVDKENFEQKRNEHWKWLSEKGSVVFETFLQKSNNETFPVRVNSTKMQYLGREFEFAFAIDISEQKNAEGELSTARTTIEENLRFFENIDKISSLLSKTLANEDLIQSVIIELSSLFDCDRAWLLYPCLVEKENYIVPYQYDKDGPTSVSQNNLDIQLDDFSKHLMKLAIDKGDPITAYVDDIGGIDSETAKKYEVKSQLSLKINTKIGLPWLLGIHQTTSIRRWNDFDIRLMKEIGGRLAQALDNLTLYKNLQNTESKVREYSTNLESMVKQRTDELEAQTKKLTKSRTALTYLLEDMNETQHNLLNANEELDALNKELESFSYSVSHDLRSPLTRLDGFSRALADHLGDELDEKSKHFIDRIRSSSQNMGVLIKDILNLSRINRRELRISRFSLSSMAAKIMKEITDSNKKRDSNIKIVENIQVEADRSLCEIVLRNLIENAWKFTSKADTTEIYIGTVVNDDKEYIYIKDNGIGFNMKYYDQVFSVFRRLHSEKDYPGTGIGLATVQRIIYRHKGEIWAESAEGEGSTFYFSF